MTDQQNGRDFDAKQHLMSIRGNQYLPVAARISWFRHDHPDGIIETDVHTINEQIAVFSARVVTPAGGIAVGYGSCTPQQFPDGWVEKASTKAIGRALAAMGYGTMDIDDIDGNMSSLADSPVGNAPRQNQQRPPQQQQRYQDDANRNQSGNNRPTAGPGPVSEAQKRFIHSLADDREMSGQSLHDFVMEVAGVPMDDITKQQASAVIERLKALEPVRPEGPN